MRLPRALPSFACAAALAWVPAHAACTVANSTLAFGVYNPVSGAPTTTSATLTVTCSAVISASTAVPYTLLLSAGGSGSVNNRRLLGGTASLPYNIYTTGNYSTVWDNTTGVSGNCQLVGLLGLPLLTYGTDTQTAYGRILASQPVPAGAYSDTLTITVSF